MKYKKQQTPKYMTQFNTKQKNTRKHKTQENTSLDESQYITKHSKPKIQQKNAAKAG